MMKFELRPRFENEGVHMTQDAEANELFRLRLKCNVLQDQLKIAKMRIELLLEELALVYSGLAPEKKSCSAKKKAKNADKKKPPKAKADKKPSKVTKPQ